MQALLSALERSSSRADEPLFSDIVAKLLRIAALVHDCGHAVMSHVSEEFIAPMPGVDDLRRYMKVKHGARKKPSVSEAFAAVFIESEAFQELLGLPLVGADFIRDVPGAARMIAGFVLGAPVVPERAFLSLLMSGATDADKLDYMPRDTRMAGVPTPVDVRRVIEKLRVLDVPRDSLPGAYATWAGTTAPSIKVLALTSSGARALDELAMGRTVLFEKIYHHHKVRAIEVMVRRALREHETRSVASWLRLVDDDLISSVPGFGPLRRRTLLKRALVLAAPQEDDDAKAWIRLTGPSAGSGDRPELDVLREKLIDESASVANLLGEGEQALMDQPPEIDRAETDRLRLDEWAYVGDSGDEIAKASAASVGQRSEAGKHAARQLIYFLAPEGAVLPVFIAARKLLLSEYGIQTGVEAYRATRLDPDVIQKAEQRLVDAKYLSQADLGTSNQQARLISHKQDGLETFLRVAWPRFMELALTFGQYQAPNASRIGPAGIAAYLRQFESELLARAALQMLEAVEFVGRQDLVLALTKHIESAADIRFVCPLGGPGDSSAFISYLINDVAIDPCPRVRELEIALDQRGEGSILLWDDFCGQGGHTITVLAQWLGLTDSHMLDEDLVERLTDLRIAEMRTRRCLIAFGKARPSGLALIEEFLGRQGLTNFSVASGVTKIEERNRLFDSDEIIGDTAIREHLRRFCEDVGSRMLHPKTLRTDRPLAPAEAGRRALGYGNESHLLVFPYNVPTVTLTALWESDASWKALFPRRTKPRSAR